MNKKGFTLVEIIVCIVIVVVIGVTSFFGIKTISNNIRISNLKEIEDEILLAARIYMETDNNTYQQLYKENNSVILPLSVLVNEGLLDLTYTDLDMNDVKDEYVITALASTNSSNENCVNITEGSWNLSSDTPIYICTNTSTGSTNLAIINPSTTTNATKVAREPFVFKGADPSNYIKYGNRTYRIYYIDLDDSMVLISDYSFGTTFDGKTMDLCGILKEDYKVFCDYSDCREKEDNTASSMDYLYNEVSKTTVPALNIVCSSGNGNISKNEKLIDHIDAHNTDDGNTFLAKYFSGFKTSEYDYKSSIGYRLGIASGVFNGYKIHLKSCMQIKAGEGTGTLANPYILEDNC